MRLKFPIILGLGATLVLTGCVAPEGDNARSGAITGAALGAVLGAVTGDNGGDSLRRAAVGGVLGGIAGGTVGTLLDRQAQELNRDLGNNVDVVNTGSELIVTMPQDILFATDSAVVRPDLQSDLRVLAASLQRYPDTRVAVIGHTDNTGSAAYNQGLSERRASSVASILRDSGVAAWRVTAVGRGLNQPVASNATPEGRQQNRRVEIVITPIQG
jgi:outer membrane protein OmpA-like peptidoglycan-associated protein